MAGQTRGVRSGDCVHTVYRRGVSTCGRFVDRGELAASVPGTDTHPPAPAVRRVAPTRPAIIAPTRRVESILIPSIK